MRTVMNSRSIAHAWANQTQAEGRNANKSFYFRGDVIYSYGGHSPIARHIKIKGRQYVLFTTRNYSVTTSSHKSAVRSAIRHDAGIIFVDNVMASIPELIADLKRAAQEAVKAIKAANTTLRESKAIIEANNAIDEYENLCRIAGKKPAVIKGAPGEAERVNAREFLRGRSAQFEAKRRERWANRKKLQAERLERQRLKDAEDMQKWLAGENIRLRWDHGETRLRLSADRTMIETSKGVEFPADHGIKALAIIRRGQVWEKNGQQIRLGTFFADRIDEQGNVTAGCHKVSRAEIERIASQLGV